MAYRHVDESKKGDDYVIGHKRLQIDETKAVFTGSIGILTATILFGEFSKFGGWFSSAGMIFAVLWGVFVFVEISTIYYSETPCFSTKSIKLIYIVFFITIVLVASRGFGFFRLRLIMELVIIGLIMYLCYKTMYLCYKMIKGALKRSRASVRAIKRKQ